MKKMDNNIFSVLHKHIWKLIEMYMDFPSDVIMHQIRNKVSSLSDDDIQRLYDLSLMREIILYAGTVINIENSFLILLDRNITVPHIPPVMNVNLFNPNKYNIPVYQQDILYLGKSYEQNTQGKKSYTFLSSIIPYKPMRYNVHVHVGNVHTLYPYSREGTSLYVIEERYIHHKVNELFTCTFRYCISNTYSDIIITHE